MNAITELPPPKLTGLTLMAVFAEMPPSETLDGETLNYLGCRARRCLAEVTGCQDEYRREAERDVTAYFNAHFRTATSVGHAQFMTWWLALPNPETAPDDLMSFITGWAPAGDAWPELLQRAAPLIEADKGRRAAVKAQRAAEDAARLAENDRRIAESAQQERAERDARRLREAAAYAAQRAAERPFRTVRVASLAGQPVPQTRWLIPRWMPVGYTIVLYGMPGTGKTLLAQMLATSCATGLPWLGQEVEQCNAFALFCEDDETVIHGRQAEISARMGLDFGGLDGLSWACPVGEENTLMRFGKSGEPELTDYFDHLREQVLDEGVRLLVLDTASVIFGGNPNDRNDVTAFLGALTALAREMDGAVLLNTHPSQAAMSSGGGLGHSIAWLGSARAVWRLNGSNGQARTLTRTKSNLSATGEQVKLWLRDGFMDTSAADPTADSVFLALLRQATGRDEKVSARETARNFAPTVFAQEPGRGDFTRDAFRAAMDRLLASGAIRTEAYGKPSQGFTRLVLAPDEDED